MEIVEAFALLWAQTKALFRRIDHRWFADEPGDVPQKPESLEDIEPIDPRSWLREVLSEGAEVMRQRPDRNRNVYSEPFEVPRHYHEDPNHWAKDLLWLVPAVGVSAWLFYLAPALCGCLLVGCGVLLSLLAIRK